MIYEKKIHRISQRGRRLAGSALKNLTTRITVTGRVYSRVDRPQTSLKAKGTTAQAVVAQETFICSVIENDPIMLHWRGWALSHGICVFFLHRNKVFEQLPCRPASLDLKGKTEKDFLRSFKAVQ